MTIKERNLLFLESSPKSEDLYDLLSNMVSRLDRLEAYYNNFVVVGTTAPHLTADSTNVFRQDNINSGSFPLVSTGRDPYDLNSCIQAANCLKALYNDHIADTTVHDAADSTNTISSSNATNLASLQTLLNELKGDYNAHRSQSGVHFASDSDNAVSSANASDLATALTLCAEIIDDFNAHVVSSKGLDIEASMNDVLLG